MLPNAILLAANSQITDDAVISNVLIGKKDEYEILIRRYNNLLYKTARGILEDEKDIEDVMQEAYIKGFEKLHQFRREARFSTWLTRILINCALQHANKLRGRGNLRIDSLREDEIESFQEMHDDTVDTSGVSENLRKTLEAAIGHLPAKYRVVFILREIEQVSVADAATMLGISEENVKIRLHRAKGVLRNLLKSELESLEIFEFHATRCAWMATRVMKVIHGITLQSSQVT